MNHLSGRSIADQTPVANIATSVTPHGDHGRLSTSSSPKRRQSLSVKLTKTSAARPLLYSKVHSEALLRIANLLESSEKAKTDVTAGRLPVEAAYVVMKRVTEATGHPILSTGLSTFNKLNSLSTEPVLDVLKTQTWREFFHQTDPRSYHSKQSNHSRPSSASQAEREPVKSTTSGHLPPSSAKGSQRTMTHSKSAFTLGNNNRLSEDNPAEQEKFQELRHKSFQLLNELGEIMIDRIHTLWQTLKIPKKEQVFYEKSICSLPIQSLEQCQELSKLIYVLQQHEAQTKQVLLAIKQRELAVEKCFDVLQALQRKFSHTSNGHSTSSTVSLAKELTQGQMFWKEELILALLEVRSTSMEVLKAIQDWRRALWRPVAFLWRGRDYLVKMRSDFESLFLTSSDVSMVKILEMLPLSVGDLQGIVFLSPDQKKRFSSATVGASTRSTASLTPFQTQTTTTQSQQNLHYQGYIESLLQQYHHAYSVTDLESAAMVVLQEESLQQAIQLEQQALTNKGVFIPILRPMQDQNRSNHDNNNNTNTNTGSTTSPPRSSDRKKARSPPAVSRPVTTTSNTATDPSMEADLIVVTSGSNFSSVRRPPSASTNQSNHHNNNNNRPAALAVNHPEEETSLDSPDKYKEDFSPQ